MSGRINKQFVVKMVLLVSVFLGCFSANAAVVYHDSDVTANETWSGNDVHVLNAPVTVAGDAVLTIEPGAIVKFASGAYLKFLVMDADLVMHGTAASPIIFTSLKDDTAGGDTNGDGSATAPAAGDWVGLYIEGEEGADLSYVDVRYGGAKIFGDDVIHAQLHSDVNGSIAVRNSTFRYGYSTGVFANRDATIEDSLVEYNGDYGVYVGHGGTLTGTQVQNNTRSGVYLAFASGAVLSNNQVNNNGGDGFHIVGGTTGPTISNNTLNGNRYGIYFADGAFEMPPSPISGNTIMGNSRPFRLPFSALPSASDGNVISANTHDVWEVIGDYRQVSLALEQGPVYWFQGYESSLVGTLQISPGAILKFDRNASLSVDGVLTAVGTETKPIVFTSIKDDVGGDTNGDGAGSAPGPGDWGGWDGGLSVDATDTSSELAYVDIRYAGYSGDGYMPQLTLAGNSILVRSSSIHHGGGVGVLVQGTATVADSVVSDNPGDGIQLSGAGAQATLTGNTIQLNGENGISAWSGSATIDGNQISQNGQDGIQGGNVAFTIANNQVLDNGGYGVSVTGGSNPMAPIQGNTITGNDAPLSLPFSALPAPTDNNTIHSNTHNIWGVWGNTRSASLRLDAEPVYWFHGDSVLDGGELQLQPGTVLKFAQDAALTVNGALKAVGTDAAPIVFTSIKDDTAGGDTDGVSGTPGAGDWSTVRLNASDATSELAHVDMRYGGGDGAPAQLLLSGNAAVLRDSSIRFSAHSGVSVSSAATLSGNGISENQEHGVVLEAANANLSGNQVTNNSGDGIHGAGGLPDVTDNQLTNNGGMGLYLNTAEAVLPIQGNTITGNDAPLYLPFSALPGTSDNNTISGNTHNIWKVAGNSRSTTLALSAEPLYWFNGLSQLTGDSSLTLSPGAVLKFDAGAGIAITGTLNAPGTEAAPILFTSIKDDSAGGDTNGDGASNGWPGNWAGITLAAGSTPSAMRYVTVKDATIGLDLQNTQLNIDNSKILSCKEEGVHIDGGTVSITASTMWGHAGVGVSIANAATASLVDTEISSNGTGIQIDGCTSCEIRGDWIFGNRIAGLVNNLSTEVITENVWWGDWDGSGPYHAGNNPGGAGDRIQGDVDFSTYLPHVPVDFSYTNFSAQGVAGKGTLPAATVVRGTLSDEWSPVDFAPEKTMVWDNNYVEIRYSGLSPSGTYRIRVSLYDTGTSYDPQLHLVDAAGRAIQPHLVVEEGIPGLFEFAVPAASYADGNLSLRFVKDSTEYQSRVSLSQIWLLKDLQPAEVSGTEYNDLDGSYDLSEGDEYHFHFSAPIKPETLTNDSIYVKGQTPPATGTVFGAVSQTRWTDNNKTLIYTLTGGFTLVGDETLTVENLVDVNELSVNTEAVLSETDTVNPVFESLEWIDADSSQGPSAGDQFIFRFNEAMDSSNVSSCWDANTYLPPEGTTYGDDCSVSWSSQERVLTITLSPGFTLIGHETVDPSNYLTDYAGNPTGESWPLGAVDTYPPSIQSVQFNDIDGDGTLSVGDIYRFTFSERMNVDALQDGTDSANVLLNPESKLYGTTNSLTWTADGTVLDLYLTDGFTIDGSELVTPNDQLTDRAGNATSNTIHLVGQDVTPPQLLSVSMNHPSPTRYRSDIQLTLQFDSAMDAAVEPVVSLAGPTTAPGIGAGVWSATQHPNDTYTTPAIAFEQAHVGSWHVGVSGAQDNAGNVMEAANDALSIIITDNVFQVTNYTPAPATHAVNTADISLQGRRDDQTSVWLNGTEQVPLGSGNWNIAVSLADGSNTLELEEKDESGDLVKAITLLFVLDRQAPAAPTIDAYPANTTTSVITLTGTKEADTSLWRDGVKIRSLDAQTTWSFSQSLAMGANTHTLMVKDRAGNASPEVSYTVTREEVVEPPPVVSDLMLDTQALADGVTVSQSGQLGVTATSDAGISKVEFFVDGAILATDTSASDGFHAWWDLNEIDDGAHTLLARATSTTGLSTELSVSVTVTLAVPAVPQIVSPQEGFKTANSQQAVSGTAEARSHIRLYVNDQVQTTEPEADSQGHFNGTVLLVDGANRLQASAFNRAGESDKSVAVNLTLDRSLPAAPVGLRATTLDSGRIALSWLPVAGDVAGYNIYRHTAPFATKAEAQRINATPITDTRFEDVPPADGTYYYRLSTVNLLDTEGDLSDIVHASIDVTPPRALDIVYTPQGNYDPATGRYAQGRVDVVLTVSEPLLTTPFLSWAVDGGSPMTAVLNKVGDTEYEGHFNITPASGNGVAYAVFSARDLANNRGTAIDHGAQIEIDTKGPDVQNIELTPGHPIKNDQANPVMVAIVMQLDEAIAAGQLPQLELQFPLSGTKVSVQNFSSNDQLRWEGSVTLPAEAGLNAPELMLYNYAGTDDLGNESTRVLDTRRPQVYQGELPPLDVPAQCLVQVLPAGEVRITWAAVEEASDYRIFRQAPGEAQLSAYDYSGGQLSYQEAPGADGTYAYAVASVRTANGETALSAPCEAQTVEVDAGVPSAPEGLALALVGAGVEATWDHPGVSEPVTYRLYRSDATPIDDVATLTPVVSGITEHWVVDTRPQSGQFYYAVTAVDAAGNESLPSNTAYLNFELLPVSEFSITQELDQPPVLNWAHPSSSIDHYDLYLGDPALGYKLNNAGLTDTNYTDTAAQAGQERLYAVVAVDGTDAQSPSRSLLLPRLDIALTEDSMLKRGIMNRVEFKLDNQGQHAVRNAQLTVLVDGKAHTSLSFDVPPGQMKTVPVIIGGYQALPDTALLQVRLDIRPHDGELVSLIRQHSIPVTDAGLTVGLAVKDMVRGTNGKVRFTLENSSDVELEVITARASGTQPSDEVVLKLLGEDGNVLSTAALKQFLGPVITLSNGATVARIQPGESFTSDWIPLRVPQSAPDDVVVQLDISTLHYKYGKDNHVSIAGVSGRRSLPLVDTPYYGVLDSISPQLSYGEQPVTLTGRALLRTDDTVLAYSPLHLVLTLKGFERVIEVMTGEDGRFSHVFEPGDNEAGVYKVAVVHPELVERPEQGRFTIAGLSLQYDTYKLTTARDYDQPFNLKVTAGEGAGFHNLRFQLLAEDQASGFLPGGISLTPGAAIDLEAGQSRVLESTIRADASAPDNGEFVLRVVSDEMTAHPLDTIRVNYHLVDAAPVLRFTPDSLGTGVVPGESVTEVVTLVNKGLLPAENLQLSLIDNNNLGWVHMDTPAHIDRLALGDEYAISLSFAPDAGVADGVYNLGIEARSGQAVLAVLGIQVTVSSAGEGQLLFKTEDIYTGTRDSNNVLITGLSGARIALQHELLSTVHYTFTSGTGGEVLSTPMKAGSYRYRVTAPDHVEATGRVSVRAGMTVPKRIFLDTNVVTVEWSVTETTIQDLYKIVLTATYAVNVPTAVIVLEPAGISLPYLKAGDVYYGELTLTNYGLIRADNLEITLPPEDEYLRVEALIDNLPTSLDAKQRIVIPYRITAIKNLEADGSGGGCFSYSTIIKAKAESICANGDIVTRTTGTTIAHQSGGSCTGGSSGGGGGGGWGGGGWGGGGGGYDIEPSGFPACRPDASPCPLSGRGGQ